MHDHTAPTPDAPLNPRRAFLVRVIQGVHATIGATVAFILGSAVLAPSLARRERLWLSAGDASALKDGEPLAVTLRVARQDGASEVVDRRVVFLVRSGEQVKAIDSTCTHLGCRTRFNAELGHIECPCHGGRLRRHRPGRLRSAAARARRTAVAHRRQSSAGAGVGRDHAAARLVRFPDRLSCRPRPSALRATAAGHGLGLHHRQRRHAAARHPVPLGRGAGDVLRAVAGAGLRQRQYIMRSCPWDGWCAGCTSGAPASSSSPPRCTCCGCSRTPPTRRRVK